MTGKKIVKSNGATICVIDYKNTSECEMVLSSCFINEKVYDKKIKNFKNYNKKISFYQDYSYQDADLKKVKEIHYFEFDNAY